MSKITSVLSFFFTFAFLLSPSSFSQEVDPDLPTNKARAGAAYYHDETPLSATHSIYSDIFIHKWLDAPHDGMEMIPQAEQDKISDTYIAHWTKVAEEATKADAKSDAWGNVGSGLLYREKWDEAGAAYEKAMCTANEQMLSRAYEGRINVLLGKGLKKEALAAIDEFFAKGLTSGKRKGYKSWHENHHRLPRHARAWLAGETWDALKLPRWTDCKPFPEPQQATYTEKFAKCGTIDLYLKGVEVRDARVRLLAKKLKSRGFSLNGGNGRGAGYRLEIALDPKAKVEKREGYTISATAKGCKIAARDMQGVLWGVVSFLQILDAEKQQVRICEIEDWPDCPRRGFYGRTWPSTIEFVLFNKLNYITLKPYYLETAVYTPLRVYCTKEQCKEFRDFGLEFYATAMNLTMDVAWPLCWNVTRAMQITEFKRWASYGLNVYYPYDDVRYYDYVWRQEDKDTGLKPSDMDAKQIAAIYNAVKAEYPDFKMQFCPPFYWGPTKGHPYPDDRTKYLKSLAEHLPKEIDVIWTGERVGSHTKEKGRRDWYANLIGRKPTLFQNKTGPHYYLSYIVDRTHWEKWFYPGFVADDMAGIQKNSDTPGECPQITTLADYLWNVKGYDAERSIKRGLDNYAGKGLFEILDAVHPTLCKYDKYKYGAINGKVRWEKLEQVEADLAALEKATDEARQLVGKDFFDGMGSWTWAVGWVKGVRNYVVKHKDDDPRKAEMKYLENVYKDAEAFVQYDRKKDILLDGFSFEAVSAAYAPSKSSRDWHPIDISRLTGVFNPGEHGVARFELKAAPKKPMKICISGYGWMNAMKFVLNGQELAVVRENTTVPKGVNPGRFEFAVPETCFRKGENTLEITNKAAGTLELTYVVVK